MSEARLTYLLDVNVVIALLDPLHLHHRPSHRWFAATASASWATCPMIQNAVLRILGNPAYPNSPGSPAACVPALQSLLQAEGHHFWHDDISLLTGKRFRPQDLLSHHQVADTYLLALAAHPRGKLATFDTRLSTSAIRGGDAFLFTIPA